MASLWPEGAVTAKAISQDELIRNGEENAIKGLVEYLRNAKEPSIFVRAILENNLFMAHSLSKSFNKSALPYILDWMVNNMPRHSFGNPAAVKGWLGKNKYYQAYQEERTFNTLKNENI